MADSLAAIQEGLSASGASAVIDDFGRAAREDFAGAEALRQRCLNAPKFGQDDERADHHAVSVLDLVLKEIDRASHLGSTEEIIAFRCMETDMRHLRFGSDLGATPDGRRAGDPISENTSPVPGSCRRGPTAMFNSLAKLPFDRINSGALNLRLQPELFADAAGLTRLATLLRTYFDLGGLSGAAFPRQCRTAARRPGPPRAPPRSHGPHHGLQCRLRRHDAGRSGRDYPQGGNGGVRGEIGSTGGFCDRDCCAAVR